MKLQHFIYHEVNTNNYIYDDVDYYEFEFIILFCVLLQPNLGRSWAKSTSNEQYGYIVDDSYIKEISSFSSGFFIGTKVKPKPYGKEIVSLSKTVRNCQIMPISSLDLELIDYNNCLLSNAIKIWKEGGAFIQKDWLDGIVRLITRLDNLSDLTFEDSYYSTEQYISKLSLTFSKYSRDKLKQRAFANFSSYKNNVCLMLNSFLDLVGKG